jgi:hypothetical protein
MAQESNLKKEFSKKDVARLRNLITGKTGDKTQVQTGYEKKIEDHKEGDTWEEEGKTWTIKNGIKQTVTKLDVMKKMLSLPLCCPNCKKPMKSFDINKKMYTIHQMCFDCVVEMESKIKQQGKWEEYESGIMNANKNATLEDVEKAIDYWFEMQDESFVSENGEIESWKGGDKTKVYAQIKENLQKIKAIEI